MTSMDPSEFPKEIYARYGLALYLAHSIERQLQIILTLIYEENKEDIDYELDNLRTLRFSESLGSLVYRLNQMQKKLAWEWQLRQVLRRRNFLVHKYFWKRIEEFESVEGQVSMIKELGEDIDLFKDMNSTLGDVIKQWADKEGLEYDE